MLQDDIERQNLIRLLRDGDINGFNAARRQALFKRIDLSHAELVFADLSGAQLVDVDLADSTLSGTNLTGASLRGAYLSNCDLTGAELRKADLTGADLTNSDLTGAILVDANLTQANLSEARLAGANLTGTLLRETDLRRADLRKATIKDVEPLGALLDEILADSTDYFALGAAFEEAGDRAVSAGRFEEALTLYDAGDHFLIDAGEFAKRLGLLSKVARMAAGLKMTRDQIESRARALLLALAKARLEAANDPPRAAELERLYNHLRKELGLTDDQPLTPRVPAPTPAPRPPQTPAGAAPPVSIPSPMPAPAPALHATRTDLQRYADAAVRMFKRYEVDQLLTRLGELLELLDDTTVLDLSVRYSVPDLQLKRARETVRLDIDEMDRLRGENFLKILQARLRRAICEESGPIHKAWVRGEIPAVEALCSLLHPELALPSPFRIAVPLLAALFVKSGIAGYCGWSGMDQRLPIP